MYIHVCVCIFFQKESAMDREEDRALRLGQSLSSLAQFPILQSCSTGPVWPPPGHNFNSRRRTFGRMTTKNINGDGDILQPCPLPNVKKADDAFWASTDVCTLPISTSFAARLLGIDNHFSNMTCSNNNAVSSSLSSSLSGTESNKLDPAFVIPSLGHSWLHSLGNEPLIPQKTFPKRRPEKRKKGDSDEEDDVSISSSSSSSGNQQGQSSAAAAAASSSFRGYNEKEFTDPWAQCEEFIDLSLIDYAHNAGVCKHTTIRWAVPTDADALVAVNKVGRGGGVQILTNVHIYVYNACGFF
jgi:hypothetical protein